MSSQPADNAPSISTTAAILLAVSVLAGTILAGLIAAQAVTGIKVYVGSAGFFGGIMSVGGIGFIVQLAAERVMRRIDQMEARMDEHAAQLADQGADNFASAFVAGAAGSRHLTSVPRQG